jgi:hypothetical protein
MSKASLRENLGDLRDELDKVREISEKTYLERIRYPKI